MAILRVDVVGETCPVPLIEVRKAIRKAQPGDVIEVTGTHPSSKKEIPLAVEASGWKVINLKEEGDQWTIQIQK
jgi:tRNA 2-thiouridine synthesizing protein A